MVNADRLYRLIHYIYGDEGVTRELCRKLTQSQKVKALKWVTAAIADVNDNDIIVPKRPKFLKSNVWRHEITMETELNIPAGDVPFLGKVRVQFKDGLWGNAEYKMLRGVTIAMDNGTTRAYNPSEIDAVILAKDGVEHKFRRTLDY